jgi:hypothetical protein
MRRVATVAALGLLTMLAGCAENQESGKEEKKLKAQDVPTAVLGGYQSQTQPVKARPGKEALVVAIGTGATFGALYVYDKDGNCVAFDEGKGFSNDDLAVGWFTPHEETYWVELVNLGGQENKFKTAVR